ncbi:MAG: hypothetical protein R3B81_11705 [bacterium]
MNLTDTPDQPLWSRCAGRTPRDRRNLSHAVWLYLAWTASFSFGSRLLQQGRIPDGLATWTVAALPTVLALFVVVAFARFLREADELQRAIHSKALAIGVAGTWLAASVYTLAERAGASPADLSDAMLLLAVFYGLGILVVSRRYR